MHRTVIIERNEFYEILIIIIILFYQQIEEGSTEGEVPEVSPGLITVLSEIESPRAYDLQVEFSKMMNQVTSPRMRKIWKDAKDDPNVPELPDYTSLIAPSFLKVLFT